ncbi:MAG: Rieske 2Fe-2S domain-containing protein, partial [Actinomycetota bacterium]|nr:Rieske 2Fe-2S domain-containing protein [Actinomycetota bacterium]
PRAVRLLTSAGLVGALPAVLTGWSDWNETNGSERRVGLVHAAGNAVGLGLVAGSLLTDRPGVRRCLSLAGLAVLGGAGWLGGHLSFALGVGVDTTAFLKPPTEWTDACAEADVRVDKAMAVTVEGTPVLVVRRPQGIVAIGDRCTHRGAPLHEGDIEDGCVVCPWHAAKFSLDDGSVLRGPASRPESVFDVRVVDGRVEVRRDEERALRLNPTR